MQDRILAADDNFASTLKKRRFATIYWERPAWLDDAQQRSGPAVAAACGHPVDISGEEAFARLVALNRERARVATSRRQASIQRQLESA